MTAKTGRAQTLMAQNPVIVRTIFHVDMDAFFASIEQRDNPAWRNRPVIVGAKVGCRGVVSAASYEARAFGVHSAMPINQAFSRCPNGIFVRPRMDVYSAVSGELMELFSGFSPLIEQISIDEAFIDMTGSGRLFGPPLEAAAQLSAKVRASQGITASIGIATNKFCAKIASDMNKPNGITVCPDDPAKIREWLAPMAVDRIWGVGKKSAASLCAMGISTIGDLQRVPLERLLSRFGRHGGTLYNLSRGIDERPVVAAAPCKSISREHTFERDSADREVWRDTLFTLTEDICRRARRNGARGSTVYVTWRTPDFTRHTRQTQLPHHTNAAKLVFERACALLSTVDEPALRLLGVGITGFDAAVQTDLFAQEDSIHSWEESERAMDLLAERFGDRAVRKGREIAAGSHRRQKRRGGRNERDMPHGCSGSRTPPF